MPGRETKRDKIVKSISKKHLILTPQGKEFFINLKDIRNLETILNEVKDESLKKYIFSEELKNIPHKEPPSIKIMRQQELIDYEPASDSGHFRFYPKGVLIYNLLIDWAHEIAVKRFGAMEIETPILYDWKQPDIREQGESFHERHYLVHVLYDKSKEWVLRFAGDFGLFRMVKDINFSYSNLPLRIYELSKSFRYEKKGELAGLRRLRGFTMPDIHCFAENLLQGWKEYQELYRTYDDLARGTGVEFAVVFRVVDEFYEEHKDKFIEMLRYSNRPAFIELLNKMKHYWIVKHEFQGIDSVGGNNQLSTVQLDIKDAKTYGIVFTNKKGKKQGPIICHSSIGAIERWIYTILESALKTEKPMLPLWLTPTQIRLLPISKRHLKTVVKIANYFHKKQIRVNIDDRNLTLNKKIMEANQEWIPFIAVIGDKEIKSNKLAVTDRKNGKIESLNKADIVKRIKLETKDKPFRYLSLPIFVSKWPAFYG